MVVENGISLVFSDPEITGFQVSIRVRSNYCFFRLPKHGSLEEKLIKMN